MDTTSFTIWPEIPENALLSRRQVAELLHIGLSTLDSLIPDSQLPRIRLSKRVLVLKTDLESYILAHRSTGVADCYSVSTNECDKSCTSIN